MQTENKKRQTFTVGNYFKDRWVVVEETVTLNVVDTWANSPNSRGTLNFKKGDLIIFEGVESVGKYKLNLEKFYCVNNTLYFNKSGFEKQMLSLITTGAIKQEI